MSVRFVDDSQSIGCDRGPVEQNGEAVETSSFMPEKPRNPLEETMLEQSLECNVEGKYMHIVSASFNEFSTQYLVD